MACLTTRLRDALIKKVMGVLDSDSAPSSATLRYDNVFFDRQCYLHTRKQLPWIQWTFLVHFLAANPRAVRVPPVAVF